MENGKRILQETQILSSVSSRSRQHKMAMDGPGPTSKPLNTRLPPEVNRIIYVRNLPFKISAEEMYEIFGKFGAVRQIRVGNTPQTRGRAYVVYEDIYEAKNAVDHLSGFNVGGRRSWELILAGWLAPDSILMLV
eukprot:g10814.t1